MGRTRGQVREFGRGRWRLRLLGKVRSGGFCPALAPQRCEVGPVNVRTLVGGDTAVSDIAVEWRTKSGVPPQLRAACATPRCAQAPWRPVALSPNEKNGGAREDLRFKCAVLSRTHVRRSAALGVLRSIARPGPAPPVRVLLHALRTDSGGLGGVACELPRPRGRRRPRSRAVVACSAR